MVKFRSSSRYARVKATDEIVEVDYVQEVDRLGFISGSWLEWTVNPPRRSFQPNELELLSEDEESLYLLCPDAYIDNLKKAKQ